METKITSVYDEGALVGTQLIGAKGFSVLIETAGSKILFDTGRRGRYLMHNMAVLGIEPDDIGKVVISHGHTSHTGGIRDLLEERSSSLNIYAPRSAAGAGKAFGPKGIRIPKDLSERADVYEVNDWMEISEKVFVSPPMDIAGDLSEVFMVIMARKGPAVISACSHAGVDKVMEEVKKRFGSYPRTYIGGVHIGKKEKEKAKAIAAAFSERDCSNLYLNHCTGIKGMTGLRAELGLKGVSDFYVGSTLLLEM